jgi:hypothetical protein
VGDKNNNGETERRGSSSLIRKALAEIIHELVHELVRQAYVDDRCAYAKSHLLHPMPSLRGEIIAGT